MVTVKYRKMLYCPKCFSREHIVHHFIYTYEFIKGKVIKTMDLDIKCTYCKEDFKLKMDGVIKE
jgi:hypothetical protein